MPSIKPPLSAKKRPFKSQLSKSEIQSFFEILQKDNPHPRTELIYNSPFELLVAVLLSAQATDKSVNKATEPLFKIANTPEKIYALGVDSIKNHIRTIGLFNTKAENLYKTCQILIEKYNSEIPQTREALESLPGVGRKTANVILNTAFRQPTMAVDTHIFRVANRTGIATGKDVLEVEQHLLQVIPDEFILDAHHWLILLGRYICVARKPKCAACLVYKQCKFADKSE